MIINEKKYKSEFNINPFIKNISLDSIYFDIESTGLSHSESFLISITMLSINHKEEVNITQLFSEKNDEEIILLKKFFELISLKKYLITYNGTTFDVPFLKNKAKHYGFKNNLEDKKNIDLYKLAQKLKSKLNLPNLKLNTIENYFSIFRPENYSGKDIIKLYKSYEVRKRKEISDIILEHNLYDVISLPKIHNSLISLYDYIIYSKLFGLIKIQNINIKKISKKIKLKCTVDGDYNIDYISNNASFSIIYNKKNKTLIVEIFSNEIIDLSNNKILFVVNSEFNLNTFNSFSNLQKNIIPLTINENIIYKNIYHIINKIIIDID